MILNYKLGDILNNLDPGYDEGPSIYIMDFGKPKGCWSIELHWIENSSSPFTDIVTGWEAGSL